MGSNGKFQYSLQPVLLTRKWDHDALLMELADLNSALAAHNEALAAIENHMKSAAAEWQNLSSAEHHLSVDTFSVLTKYMHDLAKQYAAKEIVIAEAEKERDAMIDRVIASQRGVEAVETHRDEMKAQFVKLRLSGDFKEADDQWSTLQAGMLNHDKQS